MSEPLKLDELLAEFDDAKTAWVLRDHNTKLYLVVPDDRFPGRRPIRFFLSEADAKRMVDAVSSANPRAVHWKLEPEEVKLLPAMRAIARSRPPDYADSFVVHGPNEVFHFTMDRLIG